MPQASSFLQRWPRPLIAALALLVSVLLLATGLSISRHRASSHQQLLLSNTNEFRRLRDFSEAAKGAGISRRAPELVELDLEITNIYNLSVPDQTFMANGFLHLAWPETVQKWLEEEDISVEQLLVFLNNIVSYDFNFQPTRQNSWRLLDGGFSQDYVFSGHFFSDDLSFLDFPFHTLNFPLRIEVNPEVFSLDGDKPIALIADARQPNLLGSLIEIPGLILRGGSLEPYVHMYAGHADDHRSEAPSNAYSQILASAVFSPHPLASIGQWLIPVLIVMVTVFLAPSISGKLSELRIAIPSAALLTLVVMQQGFKQNIPQLSYLTFLDLTYLWCYAVTTGLFALFVWSANQWAAIDDDAPDVALHLKTVNARIDRIDRRFQIISLAATIVFMSVALLR